MLKELRFAPVYRDSGDNVRTAFLQPALSKTSRLSCWLPVLTLQEILRSSYGILGLIVNGGSARFLVRFDPACSSADGGNAGGDFTQLHGVRQNRIARLHAGNPESVVCDVIIVVYRRWGYRQLRGEHTACFEALSSTLSNTTMLCLRDQNAADGGPVVAMLDTAPQGGRAKLTKRHTADSLPARPGYRAGRANSRSRGVCILASPIRRSRCDSFPFGARWDDARGPGDTFVDAMPRASPEPALSEAEGSGNASMSSP